MRCFVLFRQAKPKIPRKLADIERRHEKLEGEVVHVNTIMTNVEGSIHDLETTAGTRKSPSGGCIMPTKNHCTLPVTFKKGRGEIT